jgi:hypothetical protein
MDEEIQSSFRKEMRILHVITSLAMGGAESLVAQIVPRMITDGLDVEVAIFDGSTTPLLRHLQDAGVRTHLFSVGGSVYNPMHILRLRRLIKRFDIVHTHNTSPQLFTAIANIGTGVRLCTTEHNTSNRRRNWKWYKVVDRWMYSRYGHIICISKKAEDNLREFILSDSKRISTIYNGIDTESYINASPVDNFRPADVIALTMVAGFRPQKDQATLIKALNYLPEKFHLYLIGDGVKRVECERLAYNLGLDGRVHFMGIRTDVPSILKSSDYIVMSSHFEGLSLSSLEGMCVGKPFIASDVDGLHEVVDGAGILFPHQDAKALAEEVLSLDRDHSRYMEVAETCLRRAMQYDIAGMVNGYEQIYRTL